MPSDAVFANSIVSSRMLATVCRAAGVAHEETLTGFKWISRVPGLRYGYEEALGYCVDPASVRDKDGVSAALVVAEIAATLKAAGPLDPRPARRAGGDARRARHRRLLGARRGPLAHRPDHGAAAGGAADHRGRGAASPASTTSPPGDGGLPPTEGLRWFLDDDSRVIVRPSGTEPKLKVYLEVVEAVTDGDLAGARSRAAGRLAAIRSDFEAATAL